MSIFTQIFKDRRDFTETTMSRIFFISDAHLGLKKNKEQQEKYLLNFFEYVESKADSLYILGDLFDFWFEYRSVIPRRYWPVLCALKKLVDHGVKLTYVTGNHDFWMGNFFQDELGVQVYDEPLKIQIDEKRFYIAHGDGLTKKDVGYRILKKVLRHPMNIRLYRLLHPDVGFAIASFFSRLSRNCREVKNRDVEYIQFAKNRFSEGFDFVILAHTHRPQEFRENDQTYINTGDWMHYFTYGKFEKGRLKLKYWLKEKKPDLQKGTSEAYSLV